MGVTRKIVVSVAAVLLTAGVLGYTATHLGGAGEGATDTAGGGAGGQASEAGTRRAADAAPAYALGPNQRALGQTAAQLPRVGPSIIKTADVVVGVPGTDLQQAVRAAVRIAETYGGFVSSTGIDSRGARRGTVSMRVPSVRFGDALGDLEELGRVRQENVSGVDVTQEFVDLQARLRNWQAQEAVLLRLMDRAQSVTDTIRVQGELSQVQLEIERLRGRLNYLEDQTDLATITATFVAAGPAAQPPGTLQRAWQRAERAALDVVAAVIVGAGYVTPIALLGALVAFIVRGVRPRLSP